MLEPARDEVALAVVESSQVGEVRRLAQALARRVGFPPVAEGTVALIVTELANNLARHARDGELIVRALAPPLRAGLEFTAIDRGPGVADFARCLADGYSTAGTPGTGLGAVIRQCNTFDAYSVPGEGTVVVARYHVPAIGPREASRAAAGLDLDLGAICLPLAGESECGDAWACEVVGPVGHSLMLVDGLGHGPKAAEAADAALATFRKNPRFGPGEHLAAIHLALRGTRGASVAVASIDGGGGQLRYAGVGNIAGTILGGDGVRRGLVSHNGTAGQAMPKNQEFAYPWPAGSLLVMHSDGLATSWRIDERHALRSRSPGVIAAALYRDFRRVRDDVTVVVARAGGDPA